MFAPNVLKGQRILITGGGTGLGKEIGLRLLELGADLYICGRREGVLQEAAQEMMGQHGGSVKTRAVDLRDAASVDAMVESIWQEGALTGLINNAAGNFVSRTQTISANGFDTIANTVLHGTFYVTNAVGKRWIADSLP